MASYSVLWSYISWFKFLPISTVNAVLIVSVLRKRTLRCETSSVYLLCLLVAHFLVGLWGLSEAVLFSITKKLSQLEEDVTARGVSISIYIGIQCYTFSALVLVTMDRYLAIQNPLKYQFISARFIVVSIILSLFPSILFTALMLIPGEQHSSAIFCVLSLLGSVFIVFVNVKVYLTARSHFRNIKKDSVAEDEKQSVLLKKRLMRRQQKSLVITLLLVVTFIIAWLPSYVHLFIAATGRTVPDYVIVISFAILSLNSLVDPFIYIFLNGKLKRAVKSLFCKQIKDREETHYTK